MQCTAALDNVLNPLTCPKSGVCGQDL